MVMPDGLSGLDLANELLREAGQLRVIVTSGYSVDLAGKELVHTDQVSFLAKPYSVQQLLTAVRASLDSR
jgi:FixJ family two-component response regulator